MSSRMCDSFVYVCVCVWTSLSFAITDTENTGWIVWEWERKKAHTKTWTWQALLSFAWFHSVSLEYVKVACSFNILLNVFHLNDVFPNLLFILYLFYSLILSHHRWKCLFHTSVWSELMLMLLQLLYCCSPIIPGENAIIVACTCCT